MDELPPEYVYEDVDVDVWEVSYENLPPTASVHDAVAEVGEELTLALLPYDPEGDPLRVSVDGLPKGARFNPRTGEIRWRPTRADLGEYPLKVTVSDPSHEVTYRARLQVKSRSWEGWLVPGVGWSAVGVGQSRPVEVQTGPMTLELRGRPVYHGPVFDLELWSKNDPSRERGPSRSRLYTSIGLLQGQDGSSLLRYSGGFDLSLENGVSRRWIIPYYGMEVGGLRSETVQSPLRLSPHLGMWLYSDETLALRVSCGYAYAPLQPERWSGADCTSTVHWSAW